MFEECFFYSKKIGITWVCSTFKAKTGVSNPLHLFQLTGMDHINLNKMDHNP